jgi:superfamily II DNA or RNA helicase
MKKTKGQVTPKGKRKPSARPRPRRKKTELVLHKDEHGKPVSGVGPGVGETFIQAYFPIASRIIRIASAYFTLRGHHIARQYIRTQVQLRVLVGEKEGWNVDRTVVDEIVADLGQCSTDIWTAVQDLVERMKQGQFVILDAREMQTPFHAKFYICDDTLFWHGSTNYSKRGLQLAAEQASVICDLEQVKAFIDWYDTVAKEARDILSELIAKLERWLEMATPFEVYLKAILLLTEIRDYELEEGAHIPTYFQKGVIAQALRQVRTIGGSFIVAATGLGKTVIGTEVALRLWKESNTRSVIVLAPQSVHENWRKECEGRNLKFKLFDITVLFRPKSKSAHHQISKLEQLLQNAGPEVLIIIDEAHAYRNQLLFERAHQRRSLVYTRIGAAVQAEAKIVLLTATAYSSNLQNLNSLLHLLPHGKHDMFGQPAPWTVNNTESFAQLPSVTILGLLHVIHMARERGDIDERGRIFIQLVGERRYLPKSLNLHSVRYTLFLQSALQSAFDNHYFDQDRRLPQVKYDDDIQDYRTTVTDVSYSSALHSWLSSPRAMHASIEKNLVTHGKHDYTNPLQMVLPMQFNDTNSIDSTENYEESEEIIGSLVRAYKKPMRLTQAARKSRLIPLQQKLTSLDPGDDMKVQKLIAIIQRHCLDYSGKVIIFVNRYATALYLSRVLKQTFGELAVIGCTVEAGPQGYRLKNPYRRAEVLKLFSPHSHDYTADWEYNILVCTDADGIGVNLQDSNTLVNYDPPGGADVLFQRVGRIVRMTADPERIVHIYTLIPAIVSPRGNATGVHGDVYNIFQRIMRRHDTSKQILGVSVFSNDEQIEVVLDDDLEIAQLVREDAALSDVGGIGTASRLQHVAKLDQYYDRAIQLPKYLLSAKGYTKQHSRVFVLLRYKDLYHWVLFHLVKQKLEIVEELEVLDMLACDDSEPRAAIPAEAIEHFANKAVQAWCVSENVELEDVEKVCAICLVPHGRADEVANIFKNIQRLEETL